MIYFVGIHHKKGMTAFDSRTVSGKIIDEIISGLNVECKKLNLFPTEYLPNIYQRELFTHNFIQNIDSDGLYVLFGVHVSSLLHDRIKNSISFEHPAYAARKGNIYNFIFKVIENINKNKF